jgi:hypothetical protein
MTFNTQELGDKDFIHSLVSEYLDGELLAEDTKRFDGIIKQGQDAFPEKFQEARGKFQIGLTSYYLNEKELMELHALAQDPSVKATEEQQKISQLGRVEFTGTLARRIILIGVVLAIGIGIFWSVYREPEVSFRPLEYLGYEALAIEDDADRLGIVTTNLNDIKQYLQAYPGIKVQRTVLDIGDGWYPQGASVIEYDDIAQVSVVQYFHDEQKENLFHFQYAGQLSDLPKADAGNMQGLIYQTYQDSEWNIIAWQQTDTLVSMIIGRRGAAEMAELAVVSSR